jgi:hypothetical protein
LSFVFIFGNFRGRNSVAEASRTTSRERIRERDRERERGRERRADSSESTGMRTFRREVNALNGLLRNIHRNRLLSQNSTIL